MNGTRADTIPFAPVMTQVVGAEGTRDWKRLTLVAAAGVTLLDAILLQRKLGLFTGGFLAGNQLRTLADGAAFLMMAGLLNATIAAPLTYATLAVGRRLGLRHYALKFAAVSVAFLPLAVTDFISYQMWSYLGDTFDFRLMFNLTGRSVSEIAAVAAPLMARPAFLLGLAFSGMLAITLVLHRVDRRVTADTLEVPSPATALRRIIALLAFSGVAVTIASLSSESMAFGLRWTPSGQLVTSVMNRASDLDHDGYGMMRNPMDTSPLNPGVHPYARDLPGNGIDENGLAGDLPVHRGAHREAAPSRAPWPDRPPVILFVLESFRADTVGASHEGRSVTPVLDALGRRGFRFDSAWSHNGFTAQSRQHLLTGSLVASQANTSLLDDFKDRGYEVGYFSGQDETFGGRGVRYERVDRYYDAREDRSSRYSAYATPGSLAVPLKVVEHRITEYLGTRTSGAPLFLYVNFHDTHYPYSHDGLENLLGVPLLQASQISPGRRLALRQTYLNAAANVDRAVGRVIASVQRSTGRRPAVVVTSDHGESLFEGGFLGHGYALNDAQTRIPLIIADLPVQIRQPFGQSDLRHAIGEALARPPGGPTQPGLLPGGQARVFQYLGTLDTPSQIGWLTANGRLTYDFRSDRVGIWDVVMKRPDLAGEPRRMFEDLVHTWEGMQLALAPGRAPVP